MGNPSIMAETPGSAKGDGIINRVGKHNLIPKILIPKELGRIPSEDLLNVREEEGVSDSLQGGRLKLFAKNWEKASKWQRNVIRGVFVGSLSQDPLC